MKRSLLLVLLSLCQLSPAHAARSEDDPFALLGSVAEAVFDLGSIRIQPSRLDPSRKTGVSSESLGISTLSNIEWERHSAGSLGEILSAETAVNVSDDSGMGQSSRVDLRGFGGEAKQALVLLDGVRFVEPFDNAAVWNLVAPQFLEEIRIVPGAASPVYGEGALSGVIELKGKSPSKKWKSAFEQSLGSFGSEMTFVESGGPLSSDAGMWIAGRYAETDGYRQNASEDSTQTALVTNGPIGDLIFVENRFFYSSKFTGIPGPLTPAEEQADRRQKDPDGQFDDGFEDELIQNGLKADLELEGGWALSDLAAYRLRRQDSVQSFGGSFPGISRNDIGTESFSNVLQASKRTGLAEDLSLDLTVGTEWIKDDIHNPFTFEDLTFGPFRSDRSVDRRSVGGYLSGRLEWLRKAAVEVGLRLDRLDWDIYDLLTPSLEKRKKADAVSPSVSASYSLSDHAAVFGSYAQAFKAPDANALIFETPNLFRPNPEVDPSLARHAELGVKFTPAKAWTIRSVLFHIDTKKEILFNDLSNLNENFDTRRYGVESSTEAAIGPGWTAGGGYAFTEAVFDQGAFEGRSVPLVPRHRWHGYIEWGPEAGSYIRLQAMGVLDRFALNDFTNIFPAEDYWTLDLSVQKRVTENGRVYLKAMNLLDERYSSFTSSDGATVLNVNPAPGFRLEAGFRIEI